MLDKYIFVLEIIGTIAFASSGAMVGIKKQMDLLGVCVLGMTTAVGRGFGELPEMLIGAVVVFVIRILAAYFKWNLPRIVSTDVE